MIVLNKIDLAVASRCDQVFRDAATAHRVITEGGQISPMCNIACDYLGFPA